MSTKQFQCEEDRIVHEWDVDVKTLETNKTIFSNEFQSAKDPTKTWKIELRKHVDTAKKMTFLSAYFFNQSDEAIISSFDLKLLDCNEVCYFQRDTGSDWAIIKSNCGWGWKEFCKYEEFEHKASDSVCQLKLKGTVRVISNIKEQTIPVCQLCGDMEKLLKSKELADVTFCVKGEELKAHKAIVAARCRGLGQMVATSERAEVQDVEPAVFQLLLRFIYTGQVSLEAVSEGEVEELFKLADTSGLLQLRGICQKFLENALSVGNCLQVLRVAEDCSNNTLKDTALDFVVGNMGKVKKHSDWAFFVKEYPSTIVSIIDKLSHPENIENMCLD